MTSYIIEIANENGILYLGRIESTLGQKGFNAMMSSIMIKLDETREKSIPLMLRQILPNFGARLIYDPKLKPGQGFFQQMYSIWEGNLIITIAALEMSGQYYE